jgi:hypothetical protein
MLSEILAIFERRGGVLYLNEIIHQIDADPAAVEGMLETLLRMGKIVEVELRRGCDRCGTAPMCTIAKIRPRCYTLARITKEQKLDEY